MKYSMVKTAATIGLASIMALAIAGCSYSSSSETTTTVSDGETTTTTTTKTENGEATTETDTTSTSSEGEDVDISEMTSYSIGEYGIHYELPEGLTFTSLNENLDLSEEEVCAFEAESEEIESVSLFLTSIDEKIDVWDESFLEDKLQGAKETAEGAGATVTDASTGSVKTNENEFPVITLYAKTADGEDFIMSFMYGTAPIDEENNEYFVFTLTAAAQDEESLQGLLEEFSIE